MHSNLESDCSTTINMNCKTALGFVRPHGSDMLLHVMTFNRPLFAYDTTSARGKTLGYEAESL